MISVNELNQILQKFDSDGGECRLWNHNATKEIFAVYLLLK